jgi:hypothetical protein
MKRKCYEGVSKSFRTESATKYTLTLGITHWEATQKVMAAKLTRLTHKIAIQLHLVAKSCTICGFRSKRPVRKLLVTPSYRCRLTSGALNTVTFSPTVNDTRKTLLTEVTFWSPFYLFWMGSVKRKCQVSDICRYRNWCSLVLIFY